MAEVAASQGTTTGPARRWWRRAAATLAGTPLLAGLIQLPAAPVAQAAPAATGSRTVDVSVNTLTPVVPAEDDTITITGRVSNNGKSPVDDARVGLRVGQTPLSSRGAIGIVAKRKGFSAAEDGRAVDAEHTVKLGRLPTGASRDFRIKLPADELNLGEAGVYQLGVALNGRTAGQYDQVLGIQRTFLPWQPEEARKPTKIGYLWPLISTPHLTARTGSDQQQTPQFRDDSLAAELAPGGRLQQLVALGKDLPVTWVIDPDLLASVEMMTKEYEIREPDGSVTKGEGQAVARQWLGDLLAAVEGRELITLPFADPDLASLAHRGTKVSGSISHLKTATDLAVKTGETFFGRKPRADFAWPVNGAVDTSVIDVATAAGARNIITRSDSLRGTDEPSHTTSAVRPIGGGITALAADARLSTAFTGDMTRAESATLAVQEFLAHTLMVNREAPGKERSIVVAPQRMPTAHQARAMAEALEGLRAGRWSQPQELRDAIEEKPDPQAATDVPGVRSYPEALRKRELPTRAFEDIQRTQNALNGFTVILSEPDRVITPFGNAILREMSTAWRGEPRAAEAYRESVEDYLAGLTQEVKLIEKAQRKLTLSGRSGTIPVTVQNNLLQGVEGLKLVLRSSSPHRLDPGEPQEVKIGSGHSQTVKFDTTANANGLVWVEAQLYTEDGRPYGAPMSFKVNVTEITSTVMLVIAGGVLLLVLAGIRMYTQRKRAAAAREADGPAGEAESGGEPGSPGNAQTAGEAGETGDSRDAAGAEQDTDAEPPAGPESSPVADDAAGAKPRGQHGAGGPQAGPEKSEAADPGERVER